jgi:hypothetical protein
VRVRRFDRVELVTFVLTLGPLVGVGVAVVLLWDPPWWVVTLFIVAMVVWLIRFELWYQRRHPVKTPMAEA